MAGAGRGEAEEGKERTDRRMCVDDTWCYWVLWEVWPCGVRDPGTSPYDNREINYRAKVRLLSVQLATWVEQPLITLGSCHLQAWVLS